MLYRTLLATVATAAVLAFAGPALAQDIARRTNPIPRA
jgi:hypothetical protein